MVALQLMLAPLPAGPPRGRLYFPVPRACCSVRHHCVLFLFRARVLAGHV